MRWSVVFLGACSYQAPGGAVDLDAPPITPDAGPCTALGAVCAGSLVRDCAVEGELPIDTPCGWGCSEVGGAHCNEIVPAGNASNTGVTPEDLISFTGLTDATLDVATFDSTAGTISVATSFDLRSTGELAVFRFKSLHITGPIKLTGLKAIALVADGAITIDAPINALGCGPSLRTPGPGGSEGGDVGADGSGAGAGQVSAGTGTCGGGGGGYGGVGGTGGAGEPAKCLDQLGIGGVVNGDDEISTLVGGSGGAAGQGGGGGTGGGGGAAIHLVSNTSIEIAAGASINAGGCGGEQGGGGGSDAPGGGGSGGTILVEAPSISIAGTLAVNGGGGGGGRGAMPGSNATADRELAAGGPKGGAGGAGGNGAAGATLAGANGDPGDRSGAGGGGIGRIRFNTLAGTAPQVDNTKLSAALNDSPTTCTAGAATIR